MFALSSLTSYTNNMSKKEIDYLVLNNIKTMMADYKISSRDLGKFSKGNLDLSHTSFANVINGTQAITLKYIKFFSALFCVSPNIVLDVNDENGVLIYNEKGKPYLVSFDYYLTLRNSGLLIENKLIFRNRYISHRVSKDANIKNAHNVSSAKFMIPGNSLDNIFLIRSSSDVFIKKQ